MVFNLFLDPKQDQSWWDNWTTKGALAILIPNQSRAAKDRVHDYIIEGNWNYGKLADILPIDIVQQIANIPIGKACQEDYAMWEPEEDGYFSTKSAARELIQHKQTDNIRSKKQRCVCKYGGQNKMWHRRMEHQIWWTVQLATSLTFPKCSLGNTWGELCDAVERLRPIPIWKIVKWMTPPNGKVKINTDGSFTREKAGIRGIVRDDQGTMIMAFSMPISCTNNNQAEALAAKFGIQWCLQNGFQECIIEIDSLVIADMLKMRSTRNMKLKTVIDDISQILSQVNCSISHCLREANYVADILAKNASSSGQRQLILEWHQLPKLAIGYYHLDRCQMPSIRIRYDKANFFVS
ncbi:uncharacterized protein LOC142174525 [Nicotiana tabacum]|uniref:Uncharacterized protein LOC142174525 n=1 Tax=Nicotiana tabacum TaxID=4097 RepID=A0AC58TGT0_TOBAC